MGKTSLWLSATSLIIALCAAGFAFFRCTPMQADWMGILVGILAFITAVLLAVQFYNYALFNKEIERKTQKMETAIYERNKEYMEGVINYSEGAAIIFNKGAQTVDFGKAYKMVVEAISHFCNYGGESNECIEKCLNRLDYILNNYEGLVEYMQEHPQMYTKERIDSVTKTNFQLLDLANDNNFLKEKANIIKYYENKKVQSHVNLFIKYENRRQDIVNKWLLQISR